MTLQELPKQVARILLTAALGLSHGVAFGQAAGAAPSQGSVPVDDAGEYRVDFSAGRVEVDVRLNELELSEDVLVVVDRYRLTADELKLGRSDRGIVVDGNGRVAFCRCADPPVSVSFSGVDAPTNFCGLSI